MNKKERVFLVMIKEVLMEMDYFNFYTFCSHILLKNVMDIEV